MDQMHKVCCCLVAKLCLILCDPVDYGPPSSSVHRTFQARILEWVAISFSRVIFPTQGLNLPLLYCRWVLYHWATRKTPIKFLSNKGKKIPTCETVSLYEAPEHIRIHRIWTRIVIFLEQYTYLIQLLNF